MNIKNIKFKIFTVFIFLVIVETTLQIFSYVYDTSSVKSYSGKREKIVVAYGESTTQMGGDYSWPSQLNRQLNSELNNKYTVINKGGVGTNMSTILYKAKKELKELNPDYVVTMIGVNDERLSDEYVGLISFNQNSYIQKIKLLKFSYWVISRTLNEISFTLNKISGRSLEEITDILWKKREIEKALEYLQSKGEDDDEALVLLASKYIELKNYKSAESVLNKIKNKNEEARFVEATLHYALFSEHNIVERILDMAFDVNAEEKKKVKFNDIEGSIDFYKNVLKAHQENKIKWKHFIKDIGEDITPFDFKVVIATLNIFNKKYDEAKKSIEKLVVEKNNFKQKNWIKNSESLYFLLGDIEKLKGNNDLSEVLYKKALSNKDNLSIKNKRKRTVSSEVVLNNYFYHLDKAIALLSTLTSQESWLKKKSLIAEIEYIKGDSKSSLEHLNEINNRNIHFENKKLIPRNLLYLGMVDEALTFLNQENSNLDYILREKIFLYETLGMDGIDIFKKN
ncbi:hypothetical protein OAT67_00675 [Bacteriovoracaceae bacterium]|nr:hypothetical protein [Bacteriovoracaceae bacterium]